jgi:hypothetical protein
LICAEAHDGYDAIRLAEALDEVAWFFTRHLS